MSHDLFLKTKVSKLFWRAAVPGGISMLASSLYTVFDSIFVGKFLGTTAFAALGLVFPIVIMNFALAELVGVGSSIPISIALGKKDDDKAKNYFVCSILLTIFTGILSGAVIFFTVPYFLRLMNAEGELLWLGVRYARIYALFSPLTPLVFSLDNYMRICGKTKLSMGFNIASSAVTVVMELVFIKVFRLGITGAALSGCIPMLACVIIILLIFARNKYTLKFTKPRFSWSMIREIYKNGIAPFLTNISGRIFAIVMNIMLLRFGGEAGVAIYGVIMTLVSIVEQLLYGVIDSLQPAIGYNYGAKAYDRVKRLEKYILVTAVAVSLSLGLVIFTLTEQVTVPFLKDLSLLDMAVRAVRIAGVAYLVKWISVAAQCFFMAIERPIPAMTISLSSAVGFPFILIAVLLPLRLTGLWWNYPLTCVLAALLSVIIVLVLRKKIFPRRQALAEEGIKE